MGWGPACRDQQSCHGHGRRSQVCEYRKRPQKEKTGKQFLLLSTFLAIQISLHVSVDTIHYQALVVNMCPSIAIGVDS